MGKGNKAQQLLGVLDRNLSRKIRGTTVSRGTQREHWVSSSPRKLRRTKHSTLAVSLLTSIFGECSILLQSPGDEPGACMCVCVFRRSSWSASPAGTPQFGHWYKASLSGNSPPFSDTHTQTKACSQTLTHTHTHTLSGPSLSFSSAHFPKQGCLMRGLSKLSDSQSRINRKHSSGSVLFCQSINTGMLQKRNNVKKTKYDFRTLCGDNVPTTKTH